MSSTTNDILHYQRKLLKYNDDPKVLLHCLGKLSKLAIAVQHLQETGIGKTVNGMRKMEGQVGDEARKLVNKWKAMVAAEDAKSESEAEEDATHQEPEDEPEPEPEPELEPEPEEMVDSYNQEESKHSKHSKKSKKEDGSRREHNHSRESPGKEEKPKKKHDETAVPSTSGKSKSSSKSSHSQSPNSEKQKSKHKSEKSSKELKKEKAETSSKASGSKKRHLDSNDSTQDQSDEEADSGGMSFAQALGNIGTSKKKKSKDKDKDKDRERVKDKHKQSEERTSSHSVPVSQNSLPSSLSSVPRPTQTSIDIRSSDYEISPNYKPLPQRYSIEPLHDRSQKKVSEEEALSVALALKGSRTKVFSGKATSGLTHVPRLFDFCIRVLQENIDSLEYTGGVPYDLLKPVLERATAEQLYSLENFNPYLLDDTDELWKHLCKKECKTAVRAEMESWRDLYLRCHEEREAKLKSLTENIQKSIAKATPVRTTKLAYVESVAKGPRGSARAQASNGLLNSLTKVKSTKRPFEASAHRGVDSGEAGAVAEVVKLPAAAASRQSSSAPAAKKPKVAPLMQKTLKFIKNRYRR